MANQVALHHRSQYRYGREVALGPQFLQLRPAAYGRTPVLSYSLRVTPAEHQLTWQSDALGNVVARVWVPGKTKEFAVEVDLVADLTPVNPFAFVLEPGHGTFPFVYGAELARDLEPYLAAAEPAGPLLRELVSGIDLSPQSTVSFVVGLNQRVRDEVAYTTRMEHGVQGPEETLERRLGSCRDSAWLLVEVCRHVGLAARFVSGYLIQLAGEEGRGETARDARSDARSDARRDAQNGLKEDRADLHAWAEVFLPGAGWIGLDATSGLLTAENHIPLAFAPTPSQTAPVGGTVEPADVTFDFVMSVRRLRATTSLSRPYSDAAWERVRALALAVDRELEAQDVRLWMGGEPTYVGVNDPESLQWNFEALGPAKRARGLELIEALRARTAPGGLLHLGQGKWYPNEVLPRWAFQCIARVDGVAVWEDASLFARETEEYGFGGAEARAFAEALARRLEVGPENLLPAFEPGAAPNVQRAGEGAGEEAAAAEPAGFVMPLRRRQPGGRLRWSSQLWFTAPGRLVLSPGDSPIGYRIPVEVVPWVAPDRLRYALEGGGQGDGLGGDEVREGDFAARATLPATPARRPELFAREPAADPLPAVPEDAKDAPVLIRPALCVEARAGRLHVFLPFVPVLADCLELVAAVEDTSAQLRMPVWVEGYPPPADSRLRVFGLTPDPGVLEVNLPPTRDWEETERLTTVLAEEAGKHGLLAGKFGYDGSHLATGGGSHITLGGPSLGGSPILRRPDLLRSMISFWQNHPSLSYLFAGMYVGPTSQYPRVDEARTDALYELEVTFSQLPAGECPPEILGGLFRNLLVDVSGNTHRAEFCIDKLFPPEGAGSRLGLLELRAFEMPPHPRMDLLQKLLVRALVAVFWREPFRGELLRWGMALHDRFMLPHFVEADFAEVLAFLGKGGFAFEREWFAPHADFRFPTIGSLAADGVTLELRQALEPWNVLAEETTSAGTGRSVDSSLERLQVKLTGVAVASRYRVTCNGRSVPLQPTGTAGEGVAGIRYRARKLSAALHPTIPVHTPLRFALIDAWSSRVRGRCTYFAGRPDGTMYGARPADADEAKARRRERFEVTQPLREAAVLPPEERNPVYPMTLDLRWPTAAVREEAGAPDLPAAGEVVETA